MEEFEIIGEIDLNKLGKYKNILATNKVILTSERREHIIEKHPGHYEILKDYIKNILENPDYILKDLKHENTIVLLKEIVENDKRIKIIVKLATNKLEKRYNSVITFWNIRKRDYNKTIEKGERIYKNIDINE